MTKLLQKHQQEIEKICRDSGIKSLAVFGSHARGEAKMESDVDLLVEFSETPGLIEFIRTKQKLESVLKHKVDLVTKKGLSKYIVPYITQDIQQIYG
ncbi:TPA: nucleotidyltransferase [Patescibacteria group bacterium]|uniref:Polymerase nucleotidyl transferase domain-containing protein n=1 Tax=Candidatus Gottesmanbacteria bacterium GW2011_GWA1_43_11 TaxID=1618436 RepID=A0A0G1ERQ5_9BACT|nr:MAG: hypothetical protein UV59_C0005G0002 [Candidatus Gottesmanbacteria bacterium GW2011_GWA1_43_11]HCS79295.1 nucleotidyltransferase [Patescibacteria group bacterium]